MKFSIAGFALFFALISINALGQATNDAEDVVKITTKLVQVDVVVTDLRRSDVFLSGLAVSAVDQTGKFETVGATTAETAISLPNSVSTPSIRKFRGGSVIAFAYSVYNARTDKATGRPSLAVTVNLYKDGKVVMPGSENPAQLEAQPDWTRINDYGYLRLRPEIARGDYALQVIVRDLLGGKNSVTSQWIDLEVVD